MRKVSIHSTGYEYQEPAWYGENLWYYSDLGVNGRHSDNNITFTFNGIHQDWLKLALKKYIYLYAARKSVHYIRSIKTTIVSFSNYLIRLSKKKELSSLNDITRVDMVGYFAYLANKKISKTSQQIRISDLSRFIEVSQDRGWMSNKERLIYQDDAPRRSHKIPRFLPDGIVRQLNEKLPFMDPHIRRMILILQEVGMRINELVLLPFDCIYPDKDGDYFLKYFQSKLNKEHIVPISSSLASTIKEQQVATRKETGKDDILFRLPISTQPVSEDDNLAKLRSEDKLWRRETVSRYLFRFSKHHQIRGDNGKIWRFKFHDFRHTVATNMINNDVPHHIVQRFLGHESPTMTARYAHLRDETLKKAFVEFKGKMVNIAGEVITPEEMALEISLGTNPEEIDARWLKKNIMAQALPNGTCALPVISNACPHANACLTCVNFRTDHRYLPVHKQQLDKTKAMMGQAEKNGWQRQLEMNKPIKENLEKIITTLEEANHAQT